MKKKILFLLCSLFLVCGCDNEAELAPKSQVEDPIIVDEATKITTVYQDLQNDDSTPVKGFYIEYIFEDNFCSKVIYHTLYKVKSNTQNNLDACLEEPEVYIDPYIDDNDYLVYEYTEDPLFGKSVRYILTNLQGANGIEVSVE